MSLSQSKELTFKKWFQKGEPWIWFSAATLGMILILTFGLISFIVFRGLESFWPSPLLQFDYQKGCEPSSSQEEKSKKMIGVFQRSESQPTSFLLESGYHLNPKSQNTKRSLFRTGSSDASKFIWLCESGIQNKKMPKELARFERSSGSPIFGTIISLKTGGVNGKTYLWNQDSKLLLKTLKELSQRRNDFQKDINSLTEGDMARVHHQIDLIHLERRKLELRGKLTKSLENNFKKKQLKFEKELEMLTKKRRTLEAIFQDWVLDVKLSDASSQRIFLKNLEHYSLPNSYGFFRKVGEFFINIARFLSEGPRDANTQGGVFPAIFGTVLMMILMTFLVTPLGVITAIYLREYAKDTFLSRTIRVVISNMAGVPSVVYGIFALGFFIYTLGGEIDKLFFQENLPNPVFGTGGLLWASLTLALLTVPVVVVSTEEGLNRIPKNQREGSLALGATKFETLWRVVLPMCTPAILTGVILAIARAAGEVAPLMLVGVVKSAPSLPIDGVPPFIHLNGKFMHLGFYIYDAAFQSPNIEASRHLIYATSLLLLITVLTLNLTAIYIRNRLRERYKSLEN